MNVTALFFASAIAFVPLDDRPVTRQLPQMLGQIAGVQVLEPPRVLLGNYLTFGKPDAVAGWLNSGPALRANAFVLSTDMLAYGGLVASRVPGTTYADAYFRLRELAQLRSAHPRAWTGAFGTIMRLAPTGIPPIGPAANFFAPYPQWQYLQDYANLHDPPLPSEEPGAQNLRAMLAPGVLQAYLDTRLRNYQVDRLAVGYVGSGAVDRLVLGQDDAGAVGLHVRDVRALQQAVRDDGVQDRVSIEPGADELGMALVARALAREAHWTPQVRVQYSRAGGWGYRDPLEFAPISVAIDALVGLCGGARNDSSPDVVLYVRVPNDTPAQDAAFEAQMRSDENAGVSVAFADLSFLSGGYDRQAAFAERLLADGTAGKLDAYSSWNTNANTAGTALAESVAAGAGRRLGTYDALAHKTFTFNRLVDDYAFHDYVRPQLNDLLTARGVQDHTYLLPPDAALASEYNRAALWNRAAAILPQLYPGYHMAAMNVTLPWNRTFETEIDVALAPDVSR